MMIYQKNKAHTIKENMQDVLTSGALGCMNVNYYAFSTNEDFIYKDIDKAYDDLCNLISKSLKLYRNGTFLSSAETGTNQLNSKKYPLNITKVILYEKEYEVMKYSVYTSDKDVEITNPISDKTQYLAATPYSSFKKVTFNTGKESVLTPNNEIADTLGVYIEVKYPVCLAGREKYAKAEVYVNLNM